MHEAVVVSTIAAATVRGYWLLACCDVLCNTPAGTGRYSQLTLVLWKTDPIILIVGLVTLEYTDDLSVMFERDGDLVCVFC